MDLILWRHAQAHDPVPGQRDLDRELTPKGERQAERMARWLETRLSADTRVLVSPALRTRGTVAPLKRPHEIVPALAPDASVQDLLDAAGWPSTTSPVLIVGHQATLGLVAARLMCGQDQPWSVRKGGVWWLRGDSPRGGAQLVGMMTPDLLA